MSSGTDHSARVDSDWSFLCFSVDGCLPTIVNFKMCENLLIDCGVSIISESEVPIQGQGVSLKTEVPV